MGWLLTSTLSLYMEHAYICVPPHTQTHAYMYTQTCTHMHAHTYTHACIHTYTHKGTCRHTHMYTHIHMQTDMHTCTQTHAQTQTHMYIKREKTKYLVLKNQLYNLINVQLNNTQDVHLLAIMVTFVLALLWVTKKVGGFLTQFLNAKDQLHSQCF